MSVQNWSKFHCNNFGRDTLAQDCHDAAVGVEEAPGSHAEEEEEEEEWRMRRTEGLVLVVAAGR